MWLKRLSGGQGRKSLGRGREGQESGTRSLGRIHHPSGVAAGHRHKAGACCSAKEPCTHMPTKQMPPAL